MERFVGIDLTAGTPETAFDSGPAPFPAVVLCRDERGLRYGEVGRFTSLTPLRAWLDRIDPTGIAIDGPCATVGIALSADRTHFVFDAPHTRPAERALAAQRIGLFWTTQATVEHFDGAARWIARSLVLFEDLRADGRDPVETHPHGVFTMLRRGAGIPGKLAPKTKPVGRRQRLALLGEHIHGLEPDTLPDDDHVDAAAAALLASFRDQGAAQAFGDEDAGGRIWLPQSRSKSSAST